MRPTVQVLCYLYHRADMSIPEMANQLDVSGPAIWQQMSRHGIERRSVSEAMILHHLRKNQQWSGSPSMESLGWVLTGR